MAAGDGTDAWDGNFLVTRDFDAARERVWEALTEADRLEHWWGPKGFAVRARDADLRPGGIFPYCLGMPGGGEMWGRWVYREIARPDRLVTVVSFSDGKGSVIRHPWAAD